MNWRWISIAALLAALVVGYGALVERDPAPTHERRAAPPQPGYYLQDAIITQTQQDGSLSLRLVANRIEQQRRDDSIALRHGARDYFASRRERAVDADRRTQGFVPANSRVVQFSGDVELRPADAQPADIPAHRCAGDRHARPTSRTARTRRCTCASVSTR